LLDGTLFVALENRRQAIGCSILAVAWYRRTRAIHYLENLHFKIFFQLPETQQTSEDYGRLGCALSLPVY